MKTVWGQANNEFKQDFINWYNSKQLNNLYTIDVFLTQPLLITQGIWNAFLLKHSCIILYSGNGASLILTTYKSQAQSDDLYMIKLKDSNTPLSNYKNVFTDIVKTYPNSLIPF